MNTKFNFTHTIGKVVLECEAEYWSTGNGRPEAYELLDILHKGVSIYEVLDQAYIDQIEQELTERARDDYESDQAEAKYQRRAA